MAKLVEILARELKEWPDCKYGEKIETKALTQDDDGRINALDSGCSAEQDQFNGGVWSGAQWTWTDLDFERAEDHTTAIVTRSEWQAAVDALNKPEAVEWNGSGLPPVGTVCEFTHNGEGVEGRWVSCTILAYGSRGDFGETVAIQTDDEIFEDRGGLSIQNNRQAISWRPIRTPEQIAEDDRARAVREMADVLRGHVPQSVKAAFALYDAGYRKQEPK